MLTRQLLSFGIRAVLVLTAQAVPLDVMVAAGVAAGPTVSSGLPGVKGGLAPAPGPNGPLSIGPLTLGKLVDGLCPEIKSVISSKLTTLSAILALPHIADTVIDLPPGDVFIAGPTDEAFSTLLKTAGITFAQAIDPVNKGLILNILSEHVAVLPSVDAQSATTLDKENLNFVLNNFTDALSSVISSVSAGGADAAITDDASQTAKILAAVSCKDGAQNAAVIDTVLLPKALAADFLKTPAPAPAPTVAPVVVTAPPPSSGVVASSVAVAAVFMAAAMF